MCLTKRVNYISVEDSQAALRLRDEYQELDKGVVLLDMKDGRGVDPKFKQDAHVFVLLERETTITYRDILQFFGRGSRSQGHGKGCIYIEMSKA